MKTELLKRIYRILLKLLQPRKATDKKDTTGKSVRKRVVICKFKNDYFSPSVCICIMFLFPKDALILGNSETCFES